MALADPSSGFLDSLARRRAQQELLRQQMQQASQQAMQGVEGYRKDTLAAEDRALRLKQREIENERARLDQGLRLRSFEASEAERARRADLDTQDRERQARLDAERTEALRLEQGMRARAAMDAQDAAAAKARTEEERAGEEERAKQARIILSAVDGMDAEQGAAALDRVRGMGLSDEEIIAIRGEIDREKAGRDLARRKTEAEIGALERRNQPRPPAGPRTPPAQVPPPKNLPRDVSTVKQGRAVSMANATIDRIESALDKYEAAESDATGRLVGRARKLFTGYIPGLNENERTEFLANAEALNAMIFPILGRQDAPTETEVKRLEPIMIGENDTPTELRAKIRTIRQMLATQSEMVPTFGAEQQDVPADPDREAAFFGD